MANIYKQAAQRQRVVPGGAKTPSDEPKEEKVVTAQPEEEKPVVDEKTAPAPEETPKEETQTEEIDILADIRSTKPDTKSTYSLYISDAVMAEAKKLAKAKGYKKVAPFIDDVLRKAFRL